jgi:ATP-binding cassette subfamily F protein 3
VNIRIPQVERKNSFALRTEDLSIGYPEKLVAGRIYMEVNQGEHVAVLGDNGQGKTTFLRTIAEDLAKKGGDFKWGYGLHIGYYAQHVFATLNPEEDVYTYLSSRAAHTVTRQEILNLAGSFLFRGDDVKKKIAVLSGGERARAVLAGLLLGKSQVLLLDEPTNHLDFETVEALGRALRGFHGTIFFVSHDRTFVNLVATQVVEVQAGNVRFYPGNYEEYVYHLESRLREELAEDGAGPAQPKKAAAALTGREAYEKRKEIEAERRKAVNQLKKSEETLAAHKKEHAAIQDELLKDAAAWTAEKGDRLEMLGRLIASEEARWLEFSEKVERLERPV